MGTGIRAKGHVCTLFGRTALAFPGLLAASIICGQPAAAQLHQSPVLDKFVQELRVPGPGGIPVAAPDATRCFRDGTVADHYTLDINQYRDLLHPGLGGFTTLWGYNPRTALGVKGIPEQKHLGGIFVTKRGRPVQITYRNNLPNHHLLPIDTTLMGAEIGQDQNRTSVHLHGGFTPWITDGSPYAFWSPQGQKGASFIMNKVLRPGENVPRNEAEYYYTNDQSARMMWFHDHAAGTTRLNVYSGLASIYLLRDDFEKDVLVKLLGLPKFFENGGHELPLIIQDRIFQNSKDPDPAFPGAIGQGNLWYPYIYDAEPGPVGTPPAISCLPEVFGDTMLVNGLAFPKATVDPRRYRLRILNVCDARFLNLQLYEDNGSGQPNLAKPGPNWLVIGNEGGFLAKPVSVPSGVPIKVVSVDPDGSRTVDPADPGGSLITAPAERWDVVVNFNGLSGKKYILCNDAPAPYPAGGPENDYPNSAGIGNTQVLMRFEVRAENPAIPKDPAFLISPSTPLAGIPAAGMDQPLAGPDPNAPVSSLSWLTTPTAPLPIPQRKGLVVRRLTLNEKFDEMGRLIQLLGTNVALQPGDFSRTYVDMDGLNAPTETPKNGATEVWQIANLTGDSHPIHIHLINAQLLSRRPFDVDKYNATPAGKPALPVYTGPARGPLPTELGWKETIKMNPGEVTTLIMKFVLPTAPFVVPPSPRTGGAEYIWHCHILEHEEHDMMRPLVVSF